MSQKKKRGHALYRNTMSYFGALFMVGCAFLIIGALLMESLSDRPNPYIGIATYLLLPGGLFVGLVLVLWGMRRESVRRRKLGSSAPLPYPRVDLNNPRHRRRFVIFLFGGGFLFLVLAFTGYKGFHFTESVEFCGTTCHTVMEPEYTTYLKSAHARVPCVDCHVGSGVSWYVKSKISGVRQVFAVLLNSYERPIKTPVHDLRPARETCEQCHWPKKFHGAQLLQWPRFRHDEKNTGEQLSLIVKTGGGSPRLGTSAGIHWHMVVGNKVSYVPLDEKRQRIATIWVQREDGSKSVYNRPDMMPPATAALPKRVMDCIDCHNRPAHRFTPPEQEVDQALAAGLISRSLPWIKKIATEALEKTYANLGAARAGLRNAIVGFYRKKRPSVMRDQSKAVEKAVAQVQAIYARNVFPEMKTNWKTHPDNIGHKSWRGCFRCHDGVHRSEDGRVLTKDCTLCHSEPVRGPLTPLGDIAPAQRQEWHPIDLVGKHEDLVCDRCHAVGVRPNTACRSCHDLTKTAPMMTPATAVSCSSCHLSTGDAREISDCRSCHAQLAGLHAPKKHTAIACQRCHLAHDWKTPPRACFTCHANMRGHKAGKGPCAGCHPFK